MKNNGLFKAGAAVLCVCLAAGGAAGWYFGSYTKDFKVTKGDIFSEVYKGDFYEALPYDDYLSVGAVPTEQNIFDIRDYGASPDSRNNRDAVQTALDKAAQNGGIVLVSGGRYVTGSLKMGGNTTLFIEKDAALVASHEQSDMDLGCLLLCENAENITVENISAEDAEIPVIITGTKDLTVRNVTLRNFQVRYAAGKDYYDYRPFVPAYDDTYPECNRMRNLNAYGLFARYADGVKLENFTVVPREDTKRDGIRLTEVENFESN